MIPSKFILDKIINSLNKKYDPIESQNIAHLLLKEFFNLSKIDISLNKKIHIENDKLDSLIKNLLNNIPIQHLIGYVWFLDQKFFINKNVLIPRPETEELTWKIIQQNISRSDLEILDIGTGSGCIAISLSKKLKNSKVTAIDISEKALEIASLNNTSLGGLVAMIHLDITQNIVLKKQDIIVSNPPYITETEKKFISKLVYENEPHEALFVKNVDPVFFYRVITLFGKTHLKNQGKLYFEIHENYGEKVKEVLKINGFSDIIISKDLQGKERFVEGVLLS